MAIIAHRPKPKIGETWIYITGKKFEILAITFDPDTQEEYVLYRDAKNHESISQSLMDDFMATLGDGEDTLMCYFQRVDGV